MVNGLLPGASGAIVDGDWLPQLNRLRGAYTVGTLAAAAASFRFFQFWCTRHGACALPASGPTVAAFVDYYSNVYAPRTIASHLQGVHRVHQALGLDNPVASDAVRLARRRHLRAHRRPRRIDVGPELLERLLAACGQDLVGLRDQALICLLFDTLCRRSEVGLFRVAELRPLDGGGQLVLRRRREAVDTARDLAFLSPAGMAAVHAWITAANLTIGPILRVVNSGRISVRGMRGEAVTARLRVLAARAGIPRDASQRLTGHGLRVGAAQTLAASGRTVVQVMRAGRWRSVQTPASYLREARVSLWAEPNDEDQVENAPRRRRGGKEAPRAACSGDLQVASLRPRARVGGDASAGPAKRAPAVRAERRAAAGGGALAGGAEDEAGWRAALERLRGAYSDETVRTYSKSMAVYQRWCDAEGEVAVPATPETVAAFCERGRIGCKPSTIAQHLDAIRRVHLLLGAPDPTRAEMVQIARRRSRTHPPDEPLQALPITGRVRDRLLAACGDDLAGLRDRALVGLGFDSLCRSAELLALRIEDIEPLADGTARILVRASKSDRFGRGEHAYVSPATLAAVSMWIAAAGLASGPVLRRVRYGKVGDRQLTPQTVGRCVKLLARRAGFSEEEVNRLSGHSFRVGAVQELAASGHTLLEIMRAGRWRTVEAVATYLRHLTVNAWAETGR